MPSYRCARVLVSKMFQSAPDREVGRCSMRLPILAPGACFNPRPTVRSGDAQAVVLVGADHTGFNPRPTVRSGDAIHNGMIPVDVFVSIRARP